MDLIKGKDTKEIEMVLEKHKCEKIEFAVQVNESDLGIKRVYVKDGSDVKDEDDEDGNKTNKEDEQQENEDPLLIAKKTGMKDSDNFSDSMN